MSIMPRVRNPILLKKKSYSYCVCFTGKDTEYQRNSAISSKSQGRQGLNPSLVGFRTSLHHRTINNHVCIWATGVSKTPGPRVDGHTASWTGWLKLCNVLTRGSDWHLIRLTLKHRTDNCTGEEEKKPWLMSFLSPPPTFPSWSKYRWFQLWIILNLWDSRKEILLQVPG